jgi:hypothetical protein
LTNLCNPGNYDPTCFEDPIAAAYTVPQTQTGTLGILEFFGFGPEDDPRPYFYFPGDVIGGGTIEGQALRREAVLSSFDLWAHYGYMLNFKPAGLTAVETLIAWINYWEHGSLVPADAVSTLPTPVAAALQTFLMYDLLRNVNTTEQLGIPFFLNNVPQSQRAAQYNEYLNRLETYLVVPGLIHIGLQNNEPAARWLIVAMSEWSVLIHHPARSAPADLRTGIEKRRLLNPLNRTDPIEAPFTYLSGYASYNFYEDLGDGVVNVQTTVGGVQIAIPQGTNTWGGSEFGNGILAAYYWSNGPTASLSPCNENVTLYSAKYGTGPNNSVYFLTDGQTRLINYLLQNQASITDDSTLEQLICNRPR